MRLFSWFGGGQSTEGVRSQDAIKVETKTAKEREMKAFTKPVGNKTGLFFTDGTLIQTYSRARDAKRGATRHGVIIVKA